MEARLQVDFAHEAFCRYLGMKSFDFWLKEVDRVSPVRRFSGQSWRQLIEERKTIICLPIQFRRDGIDVVIIWSDDPRCRREWCRCSSESLRELVRRSVRVDARR